MRNRMPAHATLWLLPLMLAACNLAPDYDLPSIAMPTMFKEDTVQALPDVAPATDGSWKRFDETAKIEEFAWWRMFKDPQLDALIDIAMKDNPTLAVAIERVNAARAQVDTAFAPLLPEVNFGFGPQRQLQSAAAINANLPPTAQITTRPYTLYTARGTISYDIDLFGQNRGRLRAAERDANAEQDSYLAARLTLQAEIAQTYYQVASLRAEDAIVQQTIAARAQSLKLTTQKYDLGAVDSLVLSTAQTDLATATADGAAVAQSLDVAEHALATLIGKLPSDLKLETTKLDRAPPSVPAGLPSALLERRPDIKQAEELIAAANERIGIARGGYFPNISLSATGGSVSSTLADLFKWSSRTWAIGPLAGTILTQPIFSGGRVAAARAETDANFQGAVATYRGAVLTAFREVEDQLSALRNVAQQVKATREAVTAATRANSVAKARADAGYASQLDLLDANRQLLAVKRSQVQAQGQHYIATIQLVKALGGSWQTPPAPEKIGVTPVPAAAATPAN